MIAGVDGSFSSGRDEATVGLGCRAVVLVARNNMGKGIRLNESGNMRWLPHGGVHGPVTNTRQTGGVCADSAARDDHGGGGRGRGTREEGICTSRWWSVLVRGGLWITAETGLVPVRLLAWLRALVH